MHEHRNRPVAQGRLAGRHQPGLPVQLTPGLQHRHAGLGPAPQQRRHQGQGLDTEQLGRRPGGKRGLLLQQLQHQLVRDRQRFQLGCRRHLLAGHGPQQRGQTHETAGPKLLRRLEHPTVLPEQPGRAGANQQHLRRDERVVAKGLAQPEAP